MMVACFSLLFFFVNFWRNDRLSRLSDDALSLSRSVLSIYDINGVEEITEDNLELIQSTFLGIVGYDDSEIFIASTDGKIIMCKEMAQTGSCLVHGNVHFPMELLVQTENVYPVTFSEQVDFDFSDESVFLSALSLHFSGNRYYIIAMQDVSSAYLPYTTEFFRMFFLTSLIAVFVAFIAALISSYRMVRPLKKMTAATKQYAEGDFSERINRADTYSELAELGAAFNSMAENLERIDQSRSMFVSNTSHELKTPMTIISGFIDGILDGTIPAEDEEKYLRIVSEETKRLSRLVVAMLNISKIEAGKLELSVSDVNIGRLILTTFLGFEKKLSEKQIEILGIESLGKVYVSADETLLSQIFFNLVDNAVKFTPEYGIITVHVYEEKKNAVIKIKNTGRGIPEDELEFVFDRFYKVDKSRGLDAKGFGLGLYIVKSIIELHHGTIKVDSTLNEYTEFSVTLPLKSSAEEN
ncbi:MAG: HAMP domain-containing histidine kinase [Oscillospiraceae bacterium]|nr:HAMP domain-containing histidine kinase [Oscillospiraceae bacterium]